MSSGQEIGTPVRELVGDTPQYSGPSLACLGAMSQIGYNITPTASPPPQAQAPSPDQGFETMIKPQAPGMGG